MDEPGYAFADGPESLWDARPELLDDARKVAPRDRADLFGVQRCLPCMDVKEMIHESLLSFGLFLGIWIGLCWNVQSVGFSAAATTLTRTSPGPGLGTSTSDRVVVPSALTTAAFCLGGAMMILF